jgi:hypothetical protein
MSAAGDRWHAGPAGGSAAAFEKHDIVPDVIDMAIAAAVANRAEPVARE